MSLSTYGRCHGLCGAVITSSIFIPATRRRNSSPYIWSRSLKRNRGAVSSGNASMICCAVHAAVGCSVTLKCAMLLSVPKTSSLCIFRSLEPSVRTLTTLKWRSVLTVKPNVINRLLKTRSIMQERQGAEREVQCLLKIGILARDRDFHRSRAKSGESVGISRGLVGIHAPYYAITSGDCDPHVDQIIHLISKNFYLRRLQLLVICLRTLPLVDSSPRVQSANLNCVQKCVKPCLYCGEPVDDERSCAREVW